MANGRTVENESKWKEESLSPSPALLHSSLHPHFCRRHFYLSTKVGFTKNDNNFYLFFPVEQNNVFFQVLDIRS